MSKQSRIDRNIEKVRARHEREEHERRVAEEQRQSALKIKNATAREKWEHGTPSERARIRADVLKENAKHPKPYEPHKLIDRDALAKSARETGSRVLDRASDTLEDFDPEVPVRNHVHQIKGMSRAELGRAGRSFGGGQSPSARMVIVGSRQARQYVPPPRQQVAPINDPLYFIRGSFGTNSTFGQRGRDVTSPLDGMSNWLLGGNKRKSR